MQRVETLTGQFGLVGGVSHEQSELITLVEPAVSLTPAARKGRLYLLVEAHPAAPHAAAACQLVTRVVRQTFYDDSSYSLTAALRSAIRAANKALYEQNFKLSDQQRVYVGLSCAVLRDSDLFVAQVQPAQMYVLAEGRLRAIPAHPSWDPAHVSAAPFVRSGALGSSLFIEPELYRCTMGVGAALLLCSSGFAPLLGRAELDHALRQGDPMLVLDRLRQAAGIHDMDDAHALAVTISAAQTVTTPRTLRGTSNARVRSENGRQRWLSGLSSAAGRLFRPQADAQPTVAAERPDPLTTLPEQPELSVNPIPRPTPLDLGESIGERYEQVRNAHDEKAPLHRENLPPSAFLGEGSAPGQVSQAIDLGDPSALAPGHPYRPRYEYKPLIDMSWGERLSLPFRRMALGFEDRWRGRQTRRPQSPRQPVLRGQGLSYRRTRPPFPWVLLFSLVLAVGALIFYGLTLTRANDQQLVIEYFVAAEQRLAAVREAPDEPTALEALDLASQAIDEVRTSTTVTDTNPVLWLRYQELQREYERALAAVQRLNFLDNPVVLATHPLPTGQFADLVVPPILSGITDTNALENLRYLYALDADSRSARLYRIPREGGTAQPYLSPGQGVGTAVVGSVRAALWRIDQVVAIDQAPSGFGYYFQAGGNWNYSKLGASEIWIPRERLDVEEYGGNLYIWGALPNEVLRFRSGFYGDTPDFWLDPASLMGADLSTVVDMAVDGSIYLLRSNGTVLVFSQGQLVGEVTPAALTPPLSLVRAFFVTGVGPDDGYFFLVDTLNGRIVQVEKNSGQVIQQIKARPDGALSLDALASLVVETSGARPLLYVVNGGQLIRAELPAPPRSFREQDDSN
jgi:serine/threonine protein phosphatase PrpC